MSKKLLEAMDDLSDVLKNNEPSGSKDVNEHMEKLRRVHKAMGKMLDAHDDDKGDRDRSSIVTGMFEGTDDEIREEIKKRVDFDSAIADLNEAKEKGFGFSLMVWNKKGVKINSGGMTMHQLAEGVDGLVSSVPNLGPALAALALGKALSKSKSKPSKDTKGDGKSLDDILKGIDEILGNK